jgi:hypothetical protein
VLAETEARMVRMTIIDAKLAAKDLLKPLSALLAYLRSITKRYDIT